MLLGCYRFVCSNRFEQPDKQLITGDYGCSTMIMLVVLLLGIFAGVMVTFYRIF